MAAPRWARLRAFLLMALLMLSVATLATACGSGQQAAQPQASMLEMASLDNPEWGFSVRYPAKWVKLEPSEDATADPGLLYQVYLADPAGAKSGGSALDMLGLAVRRISKRAKPSDLKAHRKDFVAMAHQLVGRPDKLRMVEPFRLGELGGRQALAGQYVYKVNGKDVATVAYLIPDGDQVFWITGQASRQTWETAGRQISSALATIEFD